MQWKFAIVFAAAALAWQGAVAQPKYDVGASDTEIKIGNTIAYSGPLSAYGIVAKTEEAYFRKINEEGGIGGRRIKYISYDDAYSPPKTVEQTRKLIEGDEVLFVISALGTAQNSAVRKYLNDRKVPMLFLTTGAAKWNDPKNFPWTMGFSPNYQSEARIYAKYVLREKPDAKIAVMYQNDDFGRDYLKGLKDGLGERAGSMIVGEETYDASEPTIDAHVVKLKSTGADVFFNFSSAKFSAQAIKKSFELGWRPMHFITAGSASIGATIKPAGFDISQGLLSATYLKDPTDPKWRDDAGVKTWSAFLDKYFPEASRIDAQVVLGYTHAQAVIQVLKQCGDDFTRENVMRQAASLKAVPLGMLIPGVTLKTSADDFAPIEQMQLMKLKGESWELFGDVIDASAP
jgi:branched-chain amino acid transport system substrate-binding protein